MLRAIQLLAGTALGALVVHERRLRRQAERFSAAALESLLKAIDANDAETGAHVRRVAEYSLILARAMGLSYAERRTVELASLFHDIGKIDDAVNDLIQLPRKLTPAERHELSKHPKVGAEVLAPIAHFHPQLAEAVLSHHERWDGSGYPRGLRGRRIPLAARIVALADTFDAVTHGRHYRPGRTPAEAAKIIAQGRGTEFDPDLVDLMLLPPVWAELTGAHRKAVSRSRPDRREDEGVEDTPNVRIRWRGRTEMPERIRRQLAEAKS
jgi:putative nucleotidyltransferase with HDIG domain